jgi:hypothetical protein
VVPEPNSVKVCQNQRLLLLSHLQMAQLSTTMSQAHSATAFHFFTSNLQGVLSV